MLAFQHVLCYNFLMQNYVIKDEWPQEAKDIIALLEGKITGLESRLENSEYLLSLFKRSQFGSSSEKSNIVNYNQISIFPAETVTAPPEPEYEDVSYKRAKRKGKREEDLSGLPVERIDYELSGAERECPECGETMDDIGVKVRQELKIIPAQVKVVEHATHTYACKGCHKNGLPTPIVRAESPPPLIAGSLASPSLVAHIAAQKYSNALPLYRLEKGFQYDGVSISRQNMANWVIKSVYIYLVAIYELLIKFLIGETAIHIDETTFQVLNEPGRAAQTKSYEWVYSTSSNAEHKIVIYDYRETREGRHPEAFLKDFKGYAHTDGYQAYHNLPKEIIVVGCWAHARRRWENVLKSMPEDKREGSVAAQGIAYIDALFRWERKFKHLGPEERQKLRLKHSKPVADNYFAWVKSLNALPKSPIGAAAAYSLSQQQYLENFYLDGRLELSNNRAERNVKPFVIGRKNWLFANTQDGAFASSVMYSIIETAKENALHPTRYMEFLLESLLTASTGGLENLLPWSDKLPDYCYMRITDKKVKAVG